MTSNQRPPDNNNSDLSYHQQLRQDFGRMIDSLGIKDLEKDYLKSRWLDQVMWMEGRATKMRNRHHWLRLTGIIASAIIPLIVAANFNEDKTTEKVLKFATIGISALSTIAISSEAFFRYGERWYSYRRASELLKSQGWQFFELSGAYSGYETHSEALRTFTNQVEEIIQRDVEVYVSEGMRNNVPPEKAPGQTEG